MLGVLLLIGGVLSSPGRRSARSPAPGHAVLAGGPDHVRREPRGTGASAPVAIRQPPSDPPSRDADYPDIVGAGASARAYGAQDETVFDHGPGSDEEDTQQTLFAVAAPSATTCCPIVLSSEVQPGSGPSEESTKRVSEALVQCLANFASSRPLIGESSGPRVTRYELQLAPGTKVSKVAQLKDDLFLRARDDRDPDPRAHPGQAGGRRRGPEPLAEPRHAGRHLRRPAGDREPGLVLAREGHLRAADVDRPRAHAAHLIAGTTGSGKSGCINAILTSIPPACDADEVRLILIDPKRIELN